MASTWGPRPTLAAQGMAVLLISSEMEEVRSVSDRLIVMRMGRITGRFDGPVDSATILAAAAGQHHTVGATA